MAIERPRSEHEKRELDFEKFFIEDLHEAILHFIEAVPGDEQESISIPCAYPGIMLGLQPVIDKDLGYIGVKHEPVGDKEELYTVRLTNEGGELYARLEMLVNKNTNQPIAALRGSGDITDPAFMSTLLDSSVEALQAQE